MRDNTTYFIICFKNLNENGFSIEKQDLKTAFYCLNDCLNSGLYQKIVFGIEKRDKYGFSAYTPVLTWDYSENALNLNHSLTTQGKKAYKHYLTRFINYIGLYGYKPKYTIKTA